MFRRCVNKLMEWLVFPDNEEPEELARYELRLRNPKNGDVKSVSMLAPNYNSARIKTMMFYPDWIADSHDVSSDDISMTNYQKLMRCMQETRSMHYTRAEAGVNAAHELMGLAGPEPHGKPAVMVSTHAPGQYELLGFPMLIKNDVPTNEVWFIGRLGYALSKCVLDIPPDEAAVIRDAAIARTNYEEARQEGRARLWGRYSQS